MSKAGRTAGLIGAAVGVLAAGAATGVAVERRRLAGIGTMVFYDQRSHGRSGRSPKENVSIDQLGRDLYGILREFAPTGPVILIGHSMGGMSIMALAEQHPELFGDQVIGVGLCSTSAGGLDQVPIALPGKAGMLVRALA